MRFLPFSSSETDGTSAGPLGRLPITSGSVLPLAGGKSSADAVGCGSTGAASLLDWSLEDDPQPAASATRATRAKRAARSRDEGATRGIWRRRLVGWLDTARRCRVKRR